MHGEKNILDFHVWCGKIKAWKPRRLPQPIQTRNVKFSSNATSRLLQQTAHFFFCLNLSYAINTNDPKLPMEPSTKMALSTNVVKVISIASFARSLPQGAITLTPPFLAVMQEEATVFFNRTPSSGRRRSPRPERWISTTLLYMIFK